MKTSFYAIFDAKSLGLVICPWSLVLGPWSLVISQVLPPFFAISVVQSYLYRWDHRGHRVHQKSDSL